MKKLVLLILFLEMFKDFTKKIRNSIFNFQDVYIIKNN